MALNNDSCPYCGTVRADHPECFIDEHEICADCEAEALTLDCFD
jgi:hypothetical protein